jgi:hypothetical protein
MLSHLSIPPGLGSSRQAGESVQTNRKMGFLRPRNGQVCRCLFLQGPMFFSLISGRDMWSVGGGIVEASRLRGLWGVIYQQHSLLRNIMIRCCGRD